MKTFKAIMSIALVSFGLALSAQPAAPAPADHQRGPAGSGDGDPAPIGGIALLAAAGAALGGKKAYDKYKDAEQS